VSFSKCSFLSYTIRKINSIGAINTTGDFVMVPKTDCSARSCKSMQNRKKASKKAGKNSFGFTLICGYE
jgi:hypothetical protein